MTLAYVNQGAAGGGIATAGIAQPASPAAGNMFIVHVVSKPFGTSVSEMPDYAEIASGTSGSVANGNGTGSVRATSLRHQVSGSESGNVNFTVSSGSPVLGRMYQYSVASGKVFSVLGLTIADTAETGTGVDTGTSGSTPDIKAGDELSFGVGIKDDVPTHTSQTFTIPGCTLGTITWDTKASTTSGNDAALYTGRCSVTAGTATGPPQYTATSSVSGASSTAVSVVRLREVDPTAVQQDASGEHWTSTWTLGSKSDYTAMVWGRLDGNPATFHGPMRIQNSGGTDYLAMATQSTGNNIDLWSETTNLGFATVFTPGKWYALAFTRSGSTTTFYWALDGSASFTAVTGGSDGGAIPFDVLGIGYGEGTGDWWRGSLTGPKVWDAALNSTELNTELTQKLAVRTSNLIASYSINSTSDINDQSGNGRNLSGGSGARDTDGPNVPTGTLGGAVTARPGPVISVYSGTF